MPKRFLLFFGLISVACGGSVTEEGQGGGGTSSAEGTGAGGGTNAGPSTGSMSTSTSTSSTTNSSSSTGEPSTVCEDACAKAERCGQDGGTGCVADCSSAVADLCGPEFGAIMQCYLARPGCDVETQCQAEVEAFGRCLNVDDCSDALCSGGADSCQCTMTCGETEYTAQCAAPEGQGSCDCRANGMSVGSCREQNPSCDLQLGCCAEVFGLN